MAETALHLRLRRRSRLDLRRQISAAKRWNLSDLTEAEVYERTSRLLVGYALKLIEIGSQGVYRARINIGEELFANVNELWYPPASVVSRRGRFNGVGESKFYCSNRLHAAIYEMRPQVGQLLTVLIAGTKSASTKIECIHLGVHRLREDQSITNGLEVGLRGDADFLRSLDLLNIRQKWLMLDDYLTDIATGLYPVGEEEDRYKATLAAERFLGRVPTSAGLLYPSVAVAMSAINLCLPPQQADRLLFPSEAWMFRVVTGLEVVPPGERIIGGGGHILKVERRSTAIHADGSIEWTPAASGFNPRDLEMGIDRVAQNRVAAGYA